MEVFNNVSIVVAVVIEFVADNLIVFFWYFKSLTSIDIALCFVSIRELMEPLIVLRREIVSIEIVCW